MSKIVLSENSAIKEASRKIHDLREEQKKVLTPLRVAEKKVEDLRHQIKDKVNIINKKKGELKGTVRKWNGVAEALNHMIGEGETIMVASDGDLDRILCEILTEDNGSPGGEGVYSTMISWFKERVGSVETTQRKANIRLRYKRKGLHQWKLREVKNPADVTFDDEDNPKTGKVWIVDYKGFCNYACHQEPQPEKEDDYEGEHYLTLSTWRITLKPSPVSDSSSSSADEEAIPPKKEDIKGKPPSGKEKK